MRTRRDTCAWMTWSLWMTVAFDPWVLVVWLCLMAGSAAAAVQPANPADKTVWRETQSIPKSDSRIAGEWQGSVGRQQLVVKFEATETAAGSLVLPAQKATLPMESASIDAAGALRFEIKSLGATYDGKLSADGNEISGTWKQGGNSVPLTFRRPGTQAKVTLQPRTIGKIHLDPCRSTDGNVEGLCGQFDVYENRQLKQGRKIALKVMVLPSTGAKPEADPFFGLAGGPGQSATESFPIAGYVAKIRESRDVVLVDQRGTGGSNPLQCSLLQVDDARAVLTEPYSSEKIHACRLESDKKADTTQYTTSIAADDLDEVREALGYDKINIFGGSYGTKAALVYVRLHGAHVRTITLEAVASPQFLIPLPFAKSLQTSVDGVIALCAADAACHGKYPELRQEFDRLLQRLDKAPARFELKGQRIDLSREMFLSKLRSLLYIPQVVSGFPYMVHSAYNGNWNPYAETVLALTAALEHAVARGATFSAICAEDVPALTPGQVRRATAGTYLGDAQVARYREYCRAWGPAGSVPKGFYGSVKSNVPALLISGALDPATPPATARVAAHDLVNSRLIEVKQGTHGTGSTCVDGLIADFVKRGTAEGLDTSCVDAIHLPPFAGTSAN